MTSKAATPDEYIAELPEDRKEAITALRKTINKHIPKGYEAGMQYGMPAWYVPHSVYPPGYHCDIKQPLPFCSIASQKNHIGIYLFCIYGDDGSREKFAEDWVKAVGKIDMGKGCIRARKLEQIPLDVVGKAVEVPVEEFIAQYEGSLADAGIKHKGKK